MTYTNTHTHTYYVYIDHVYRHSASYHLQQQLVYFLVSVGPPAIAMSSFLFLINTQDKTQFHVFRNYRYHYTTSLQIEVIFSISMIKKLIEKYFTLLSHYFYTFKMISSFLQVFPFIFYLSENVYSF